MESINRRTLLTGACAILAIGSFGLPAVASTAVRKLSGGRLSVNLKAVPELSKVGGAVKIGLINGAPVAIARISSTEYSAFNLQCPHQQVMVVKDTKGWVCPAHSSKFNSDGGLISGPAITGLAKVAIKVVGGVATVG